MSTSSSGPPPPQAVHHELRTAGNSAGYLMSSLEKMHRVNPHLKLLDVGAGSGSISATLAKAIQPDGLVVATDKQPDILPRAQAIAVAMNVFNIEFKEADVFALPFDDATFDATHCHQVLAHLARPADAIREMLRVTKPGGLVAAREGDFETECVWPESAGMTKFHALSAGFIGLGGGSPKAGRQLLSWVLQAGVARHHITPSFGTWCYHDEAERKTWAEAMVQQLRAGRLRSVGLARNLTSEEDLEEMAIAWENWAQDEAGILGMMHGQVLIQKE